MRENTTTLSNQLSLVEEATLQLAANAHDPTLKRLILQLLREFQPHAVGKTEVELAAAERELVGIKRQKKSL